MYKYLLWNRPLYGVRIHWTAEEEEEEERMKRIFHLVPRRKRSLRRPRKDPPDPSRVSRRKRTAYTYTWTPPKWIPRLKTEMKIANDPELLIEKTLDVNDVDPSLNRLNIPWENLNRNDFLVCEERRILLDESINKDGRMGVAAFLVDQRTKQWNVVLKIWVRMTESGEILSSYLLSGEWSHVVEANGLRDDDNISLWTFRCHGLLFFALDFAGDSIDFLE